MFDTVFIPLLFGFAVFMFGMKLMELALHRLAGPRMDTALRRSTSTPLRGLAVGTVATALLQSSTAVTVLAIGLVNAGLMTFPRTLGIVLGANVGTTVTTELIGLNIHKLAVPLLAAAAAAWLMTIAAEEGKWLARFRIRRRLGAMRSASVVVFGFGLLLAGLTLMQSIGPHIQQSGTFAWFIDKSATSMWWGLAAGALLTSAIHSSAAVIGLVMGLATIGAMPIELGVAVVLGANIGTCATALLASLGGSLTGRFVAYSHIVLNAGGALLFMPFTAELAATASLISASPAAQIAHTQTIFNIACSLLALPLCYLKSWKRMEAS